MAQSLVKLTLESNQYEANLRKAKKSWDDFMKGIGVSIPKFTGVAAAVGAVTTAVKVAKDAFMANEKTVDEWGRTVEAAGALYDGFLKSINNADIGGFLSRMDDIVNAARAAYDALDELETFNAFNQINAQSTRTKFTEDYAAYRSGQISKEQVQASAKAYQEELRQRQRLEQDAYEKAVAEAAAKMGVPRGNLEQILSEYSYEQFNELKSIQMSGKATKFLPGQFATPITVPAPADGTEEMAEALRQLTDQELQSLQALGAQAQRTGEEIAQVDKQLVRVLGSKDKENKTKKTSTKREQTEFQINQQKINALEQEYIRLGDESTDSSRERQAEIQREIELLRERNGLIGLRAEQAQGRFTLGAGDFQRDGLRIGSSLFAAPNDLKGRDGNGKLKLMLDDKSMKAVTKNIEKSLEKQENSDNKTVGALGSMVSGVSGILSGLNQLGIEVPEGLAKMLGAVQVMTGIISTISSLVTLIAVRKSIPLFAGGGLVHAATGYTVPGNYMSNDKVPILANSGELILNRAQQGNLVSQMAGANSGGGQNLQPYLTGEVMWLGLNNFLARKGLGEIVTTRG